ncbi:endolytic transglycosylase MltG [Amphibiibacter pelophylacis]|uniref:Endolytic transglycosylase MltG n=1 Tax=Amphibiibacter pelophylacis TaxID=1799477 RepID=A0ACC6P3V2_9BURK
MARRRFSSRPTRRWWPKVLLAFVLLAGACALAAYLWLGRPLPLAQDRVRVVIPEGTGARKAAQLWVAGGVQADPRLLALALRFQEGWGGDGRLRAGGYELRRGDSARRLAEKMMRGEQVLLRVRITEGWTFAAMRRALAKADDLTHETAAWSDAELMDKLGAPGVPPEGQFFPDTYSYTLGSSDWLIWKQAYRAMQKRLDQAWTQRAPDSPLKSPEELLKLASIVEKETGHGPDRGKVAGVFINRLRKGMRLQTDPTVIYGMGEAYQGRIRRRDLDTDTPWNTYTRAGLPATPIALPGQASLDAAAKPDATDALYFVARGNGESQFSASLDEHNQAVDRYIRGKKP